MERSPTNPGVGSKAASTPNRLSPDLEAELERLLREIRPSLVRTVFRISRDHCLAEDMAQEGCIAVIQAFRSGENFRNPLAYATTATRNALNSYFRLLRTKMEKPTEEFPEFASPWPRSRDEYNPAASLEYLEMLAAVEKAIGNDRQFFVWEHTHVWGFTGVEIAEELSISTATVSKDLTKATKKASKIPKQ